MLFQSPNREQKTQSTLAARFSLRGQDGLCIPPLPDAQGRGSAPAAIAALPVHTLGKGSRANFRGSAPPPPPKMPNTLQSCPYVAKSKSNDQSNLPPTTTRRWGDASSIPEPLGNQLRPLPLASHGTRGRGEVTHHPHSSRTLQLFPAGFSPQEGEQGNYLWLSRASPDLRPDPCPPGAGTPGAGTPSAAPTPPQPTPELQPGGDERRDTPTITITTHPPAAALPAPTPGSSPVGDPDTPRPPLPGPRSRRAGGHGTASLSPRARLGSAGLGWAGLGAARLRRQHCGAVRGRRGEGTRPGPAPLPCPPRGAAPAPGRSPFAKGGGFPPGPAGSFWEGGG